MGNQMPLPVKEFLLKQLLALGEFNKQDSCSSVTGFITSY
jgi:hypothetical protein